MKIGLEHTIRNVISESLGGGITTDKPQKVGKAFFKSVHIEPKKGEEHVNGSSSVRAARNAQVQSSSSSVKEEAQLDEYAEVIPALKAAGKAAAPYVDDAVKMLDDLFKTKPAVKPKLPEAPASPKPSAPAVKPKPPEVSPIPEKSPEAPKPNAPVVKPVVKPEVNPSTKTIPTPTETPTTEPTNKLKKEPSTAETPATKPASGTSGNGSQTKTRENETEDKKRRRLPFPTLTIDPVPLTGVNSYVPVDTYTHIAQERRTYGESTDAYEKRENIEVVARPKNKNRTRQAEIIRKIIEEKRTKKKKTLSTVEINPQLNPEEPDKN